MARSHGAVERFDDFVAVALFGGDENANRSPRLLEQLFVLFRDISAIVQDGEAHDVKIDVEVANLARFEKPPRSHPGPGADGVHPEINVFGHDSLSVVTFLRVLPTQ